MRPVSVFANGPDAEAEQLRAQLRGPWRQAARAVMVLPRRAVVLAEDETHLNLLPHVRASWTLRGRRPEVPTPGKNRKVTCSARSR